MVGILRSWPQLYSILVDNINKLSLSLVGKYYKKSILIMLVNSAFRLKREREERRLQQSANPRGTITLSINATDMFMKYYDEYEIM